MAVVPGAEAFHHDGGRTGVLLCHGFTGSPVSLRPWGEHLAAHGLTVSLPLLPGHGTRWQEMQRTTWDDWYATVDKAFRALSDACDRVFLMGLSMGGALALRLAQQHGSDVAGLVLVNPAVLMDQKGLRALPVVKRIVPSLAGICNDVKKPGADECAYARVPLRALHELVRGTTLVRADLAKVDQPLLMFRSTEDHVVSPASGRALLAGISSNDVEERLCEDSYHVATLDNDAERIFVGSVEFVQRLADGQAGHAGQVSQAPAATEK